MSTSWTHISILAEKHHVCAIHSHLRLSLYLNDISNIITKTPRSDPLGLLF